MTAIRDAIRGLRAGRGTIVLAFAILTLTMAAGTVTFSVVDATALRPLPYDAPHELIGIWLPGPTPGSRYPPSPQDYFAWRDEATSLTAVAGARRPPPMRLQMDGTEETLSARMLTANYLDLLGVRPVAGRFFGAEHERPGGPAVVILSHSLWVSRFDADPAIIGRTLSLGQETREVIGVLPDEVSYASGTETTPDLYIPYVISAAEPSNARGFVFVVGRVRPDVSLDQATADVQRVSSAIVVPLHDQVVGTAKTWLLFVLAAVGVVLLVACANVANLLLARAVTRAREFATRETLGASRSRLAATLLIEGLILALVASGAAAVLSIWGVGIAAANLPPGPTRVSEIAVDGRVLGASIAVAIVCALVFSSAPAWMAARNDLLSLMKGSGGAIVGGRRRNRALSAFLMADVAFVSLLLVATALVVTTFVVITTADLGFDRRNVVTFSYSRSVKDVPEAERHAAAATVRADILQRARAVPGVVGAAIITNAPPPLHGGSVRYDIELPGRPRIRKEDWLETRMVTPGYFEVMGMQLIRGRLFEPADRAGAPPVMLINDVAARRFFPDRDPVGQVVRFRSPTTIIGVLRGVRFGGPEAELRAEMYIPADQEPHGGDPAAFGVIIVRSAGDPRAIAPALRDAIRPAVDGEPSSPDFLGDHFRQLTATRRFNAGMLGLFGVIAVAIAALGIYGTTSFVVAQQVRAIGLRMALGASPSQVRWSVVRTAILRAGAGILIGLTAAWLSSNVFSSFLFGIRPTEITVYVAVAVVLAGVSAMAALVPARRASRLDPLTALRHE